MNEKHIPLNLLPIEKKARVKILLSNGKVRRRMLDLGIISGTEIKAVQKSPSGDPTAYCIRGTIIAIRSEQASKVLVEVT